MTKWTYIHNNSCDAWGENDGVYLNCEPFWCNGPDDGSEAECTDCYDFTSCAEECGWDVPESCDEVNDCPQTCFGYDCDYWVTQGWSCDELESQFGSDGCCCGGCNCGGGSPDDCGGQCGDGWDDYCTACDGFSGGSCIGGQFNSCVVCGCPDDGGGDDDCDGFLCDDGECIQASFENDNYCDCSMCEDEYPNGCWAEDGDCCGCFWADWNCPMECGGDDDDDDSSICDDDMCNEGCCPEGTYWDGSSCYGCWYCCDVEDDSDCDSPYNCADMCGCDPALAGRPQPPTRGDYSCPYEYPGLSQGWRDCAFMTTSEEWIVAGGIYSQRTPVGSGGSCLGTQDNGFQITTNYHHPLGPGTYEPQGFGSYDTFSYGPAVCGFSKFEDPIWGDDNYCAGGWSDGYIQNSDGSMFMCEEYPQNVYGAVDFSIADASQQYNPEGMAGGWLPGENIYNDTVAWDREVYGPGPVIGMGCFGPLNVAGGDVRIDTETYPGGSNDTEWFSANSIFTFSYDYKVLDITAIQPAYAWRRELLTNSVGYNLNKYSFAPWQNLDS